MLEKHEKTAQNENCDNRVKIIAWHKLVYFLF